jgi:mevalonate pyrophosphate decarboxylase
MMRNSNHEFTIADVCLLAENEMCRMNAMLEDDISPSRSANKQMQMFLEWVVDARGKGEQGRENQPLE